MEEIGFQAEYIGGESQITTDPVVSNHHRAIRHLTRVMYSRVRVSMRNVSPSSTKSGT